MNSQKPIEVLSWKDDADDKFVKTNSRFNKKWVLLLTLGSLAVCGAMMIFSSGTYNILEY